MSAAISHVPLNPIEIVMTAMFSAIGKYRSAPTIAVRGIKSRVARQLRGADEQVELVRLEEGVEEVSDRIRGGSAVKGPAWDFRESGWDEGEGEKQTRDGDEAVKDRRLADPRVEGTHSSDLKHHISEGFALK